jgi:methyl-accepting chemotaxis protein
MNRGFASLGTLTLFQQFAILIAIVMLGFAIYGGISISTLRELQVNGPVYRQIVKGKDLIADILPPPEYIIESYLVCMQIEQAEGRDEVAALVDRLRSLKKDYDDRHAYWEKEDLTAAMRVALLEKAHGQAGRFYELAFEDFVPAIQRNDRATAKKAFAAMAEAYRVHRIHIDQTVQLANQFNQETEASAASTIQSAYLTLAAIFLLSLAGAVAYVILMTSNLHKQLGGEIYELVAIAQNIAAGNVLAGSGGDGKGSSGTGPVRGPSA